MKEQQQNNQENAQDLKSQGLFWLLSDELLLMIFLFLSKNELLTSLFVNRRFKQIVLDSKLWQFEQPCKSSQEKSKLIMDECDEVPTYFSKGRQNGFFAPALSKVQLFTFTLGKQEVKQIDVDYRLRQFERSANISQEESKSLMDEYYNGNPHHNYFLKRLQNGCSMPAAEFLPTIMSLLQGKTDIIEENQNIKSYIFKILQWSHLIPNLYYSIDLLSKDISFFERLMAHCPQESLDYLFNLVKEDSESDLWKIILNQKNEFIPKGEKDLHSVKNSSPLPKETKGSVLYNFQTMNLIQVAIIYRRIEIAELLIAGGADPFRGFPSIIEGLNWAGAHSPEALKMLKDFLDDPDTPLAGPHATYLYKILIEMSDSTNFNKFLKTIKHKNFDIGSLIWAYLKELSIRNLISFVEECIKKIMSFSAFDYFYLEQPEFYADSLKKYPPYLEFLKISLQFILEPQEQAPKSRLDEFEIHELEITWQTPTCKYKWVAPNSDVNELLHCLLKNRLLLAVHKAQKKYQEAPKQGFFLSMLSSTCYHGPVGLQRVSNFLINCDAADSFADLVEKIIEYLGNPLNGNLDRYSFRTFLILELNELLAIEHSSSQLIDDQAIKQMNGKLMIWKARIVESIDDKTENGLDESRVSLD